MVQNNSWIQQTLTELRKRDRRAQQTHLETTLDTIDSEQRLALRQAIQMRQAKVQSELRAYQTHRQADAARKIRQKEAMLSRYHWLLHIIEQYGV